MEPETQETSKEGAEDALESSTGVVLRYDECDKRLALASEADANAQESDDDVGMQPHLSL